MARQNLPHRFHQLVLGNRELRRTGGLPLGVGADGLGGLRALDQVLDLDLPRSRSFEPWMTTQGLLRLSAYFICAFMPDEPR